MDKQIENCPFCDGVAKRLDLSESYNFPAKVICCTLCAAQSAICATYEAAERCWNTRITPTPPVAQEELAKTIGKAMIHSHWFASPQPIAELAHEAFEERNPAAKVEAVAGFKVFAKRAGLRMVPARNPTEELPYDTIVSNAAWQGYLAGHQASGAEHIAGLVGALEEISYCVTQDPKVDESPTYEARIARRALSTLPPRLKGK